MSRGPHRRPRPQPTRPVEPITDFSQLPVICNAADVAKLYRTSIENVQKWARAGKIPCFKISGSWLFPRDELLSHMTQQIYGANTVWKEAPT